MTDYLESPPTPAPWRDVLLIVLLAPALVAGCYSAGFLEYDDSAHYTHEQVMPEYPLKDIFRAPHGTYFPMVVLSYRLDRLLFEADPYPPMLSSKAAPGVRIHSLLWHILAGVFIWRALLHLKLGRWMSLFAAAAWTVHPAACESVCWISERKNVLAAVFGFASLWAYFGGVRRPWPRAIVTGVLFLLGMWSKPTEAGMLPVYILYDVLTYWEQRRALKPNPEKRLANSLPPALLYFVCVGIILILAKINFRMDSNSHVTRAGGSLWTVALTDIPILVRYIYNSLIPASLSIFYYCPVITSLASSTLWVNAFILALILAGTVWISPNRARTIFLWGWFFGALGPALNIVPIPYLMQDRFAYFSLPALLVIAAETVVQLFRWVRSKTGSQSDGKLGAYSTIGVVVCVALMAALRSSVYNNDFELQHDAILKQPDSAYAQLHYALTLAGSTDIAEYSGRADPASIQATRQETLKHLLLCEQCADFDRMLDPGRVRILVAVENERLGNLDGAYAALQHELTLPQKPYNLGLACLAMARIELVKDRPEAGLQWLETGTKALGGPSPEMLYIKGLCLEKLKRTDAARTTFSQIPSTSLAYKRAQARLALLH